MGNKNDTVILDLRQQIDTKLDEMGPVKKFRPTTNCTLELYGQRYNINVISEPELVHLLVTLKTLMNTANSMNLAKQYIISGYNIADWIEDIHNKLKLNIYNKKRAKLSTVKTQMQTLLSSDKRIELELNSIKDFLDEF